MTPAELTELIQMSGGWGLSTLFGIALVWMYKSQEKERKRLIDKLEAKDERLYQMGIDNAKLTIDTNDQIRQLIDFLHVLVRDQ